MYEPLKEISGVLNDGLPTDTWIMIFRLAFAFFPASMLGATLYERIKHRKRKAAGDTGNDNSAFHSNLFFTAILLVALPLSYIFIIPKLRENLNWNATNILKSAKQQRLAAEPLRDGGNIVSDKILIRDRGTENLFGQPVETSTWSVQVDTAQAREIDRILTGSGQGSIVWLKPDASK